MQQEMQQKFEDYLKEFGRKFGWNQTYIQHETPIMAAGLAKIVEEAAA